MEKQTALRDYNKENAVQKQLNSKLKVSVVNFIFVSGYFSNRYLKISKL